MLIVVCNYAPHFLRDGADFVYSEVTVSLSAVLWTDAMQYKLQPMKKKHFDSKCVNVVVAESH